MHVFSCNTTTQLQLDWSMHVGKLINLQMTRTITKSIIRNVITGATGGFQSVHGNSPTTKCRDSIINAHMAPGTSCHSHIHEISQLNVLFRKDNDCVTRVLTYFVNH